MKVIEKSARALKVLLKLEPPITSGQFEVESLPALLGTDSPVILEVGCNDGTETNRFLSMFGSGARVYAFEPDPRAIKRFRERVTDPRAHLFEMAIADREGTTEFYVSDGVPTAPGYEDLRPEGWDLSGSIRRPKEHIKEHPWCRFDQKITIQTQSLDNWCRQQRINHIDFIWVDVQGAEVDFIRGAAESLKKTRYIYTEYSNKQLYEGQVNLRQLLQLLPDFEVVHRYIGDVLLRNRSFNS